MKRIGWMVVAAAPWLGGLALAQSFDLPTVPGFSLSVPNAGNVDVPVTSEAGVNQRPSPMPSPGQRISPELPKPAEPTSGAPTQGAQPTLPEPTSPGTGPSGAQLGVSEEASTPAMPAQSTPLDENEDGRYDMQGAHGSSMPNAQPGVSR